VPVRTGSETIVVVDDQPVALKFCSSALRVAGYRVLTASSGKKALEFFQPNRPLVDLALIDIVMPEMSGIDLIKAAERLNPPKRIILMSGYAPDEVKRLVGPEAADYRSVWKPFEAETLLRLVRNVLDAPVPTRKGQAALAQCLDKAH
jgi:DNA-binding NtrC family response regulator